MTNISSTIAEFLHTSPSEISNIRFLKKGMTNHSFLFCFHNEDYIFRLPGEGTDQLVDRQNEMAVYEAIAGQNICSDPIYIDNKGYKITRFIENSRVCNPQNSTDVKECILFLKKMHNRNLKVRHSFDLVTQIKKYERLWGNNPSIHNDYNSTKEHVLSLMDYVNSATKSITLTHIDAVPDNFLITSDGRIELIDWEYAGMQDPHVDIAMFAIYSFYTKEQLDSLINLYFNGNCSHQTRIKIYCYVAICGLLWSNWCEYKRILGNNFGDYAIKQYNYAKDFYKIITEEAH